MKRSGLRRRGLLAAVLLVLAQGMPARGSEAPVAQPALAKLELKMFQLVNADRKANGKPEYVYDEALAAAARAHSADMRKNGFFGHESPTTGMVADRLAAVRVRVMGCGENVAMNPALDAAEAALMQSSGHRANILSDQFTRAGIGIVQAPNSMLYVTQVFAQPAPNLGDLAALPAKVATQWNAQRTALRLLLVKLNADLNRVAAEQAAALARAGKPVEFDVRAKTAAAGLKLRTIGTATIMSWNPAEDIARAEVLLEPSIEQAGLGFAENTDHKHLGYGIVWAVVIFASE